jgi:transmembrane sensor
MGDDGKAGAELSGEAIDWLVALDCGTADEQAFSAWRNADPRHAAAFAQVAATWRRTADPRLSVLLDQPADANPPVYELPVPPRALSRRAVAGGAIATMLSLASAGAILAWPRRAFAETAVGECQTIPLPDGSHAMLNTDTRVAWHFGETREFWVERGEAALLVRRGEKPFQLRSDPIDARLSEGKFSLRLDPTGGQLLVLAGSAAAVQGAIHGGSSLTVSDGSARIAALSPDAIAADTAWQNGKIVFNGMTLDRAVAEFNRYLPDKIVLQQGDLATTRLGGEFLIDDPDTFLLGLQESFDIGHRRQGNQILLFRKRR